MHPHEYDQNVPHPNDGIVMSLNYLKTGHMENVLFSDFLWYENAISLQKNWV